MSNETDLDWLARNVHVWQDGMREVLVCYPRNVATLIWSCVLSDAGWITKAQWLDRRAELQNKPSWGEFRESAIYMAQDSNGAWRAFECEPTPNSHMWNAKHGWRGYKNIDEPDSWRGAVLGDWRDTLERRPVQTSADIEVELVKAAFAPFISIEDNREQVMAQQQEMKQDNGWFERGELPPVGMGCTAVTDGIPDANCIIIAISTEQVVVKWTENQMFDVLDMPGWSFRPIRTERDELIDVLKGTHAASLTNLDMLASAILAAGFKRGGV